MKDVKTRFAELATLTPDELDSEVPTMLNLGTEEVKGQTVRVFAVADPTSLLSLFDSVFKGCIGADGGYRFPDGSKAKYIKSRRVYEFKQYGKVFARITWR